MNSGDSFKNKFAFAARPDYRGTTINQAVFHFADASDGVWIHLEMQETEVLF